jgi:hypothetical protein
MPEITKRRVTMRDQNGGEAVDYVRPDFLDAYVADAKTRWETVEVSDEPDASASAATVDIPSGTTIVGAGVHSAVTAGTYYDGGTVTSQAFASQGTYAITPTYTQS